MDVRREQILAEIQNIIKVNERVLFLYNHFPLTIQSDRTLIDEFVEIFSPENMSEEGITRAGRRLRAPHKNCGDLCEVGSTHCYKRHEKIQEQCEIKESAYRQFYGKPQLP